MTNADYHCQIIYLFSSNVENRKKNSFVWGDMKY
jgi:hypothetical protein